MIMVTYSSVLAATAVSLSPDHTVIKIRQGRPTPSASRMHCECTGNAS